MSRKRYSTGVWIGIFGRNMEANLLASAFFHAVRSVAGRGAKIRSRQFLSVCALFVLGLSGCGYLKNRVSDACDIVYCSGGWGPGLSAEVFLSHVDFGVGYDHATIVGWEGRSWLYREERFAGLCPFSTMMQRDLLDVSWIRPMSEDWKDWIAPATLPDRQVPYINRRFVAFGPLPFDHLGPEPVKCEFAPRVFPAGSDWVNWGVGAGVGIVIVNARSGARPTKILDFVFGFAGFHVFPPYRPFTNTLDASDLQARGVRPSPISGDSAAFWMNRLKTPGVSEEEKIYCVKELGLMGAEAARFLQDLRALLQKPHFPNQGERLRIHIAVVVDRIAPNDTESIEFLKALLDDPREGAFAREALAALRGSGDSVDTRPGDR